jgi:KDO2-lipid IV(A) lauroyltransferase
MLILFRWFSRCPLWLLHAVGAGLGWLTYVLSPTYRKRFDANSRIAGVARASRPAIAHAGRMVMELPYLWLRPAGQPIGPSLIFEGAEVVAAAHAKGRGVLFLTPHMGSFEVTAQAYAERFADRFGAVTVLFRPARKEAVRRLMDGSRERAGILTAPATLAGVRQMLRALRKGEAVGLLPDQVPPEGMGVWAPFFGQPAYTMTLATRLVQQTGAVLLLIWGERLPHGAGYRVRVSEFSDALPADPAAQVEAAAIINRAMERVIRQRPDQYLWGYNRYKTPRSAASGVARSPASD